MSNNRITMRDAQHLMNIVENGIRRDLGHTIASEFAANYISISCCDDGSILIITDSDWQEPANLHLDRRLDIARREVTSFMTANREVTYLVHKLREVWVRLQNDRKANRVTGNDIINMTNDAAVIFGVDIEQRRRQVAEIILLLEHQGLLWDVNRSSMGVTVSQKTWSTFAINGELALELLNRETRERRMQLPKLHDTPQDQQARLSESIRENGLQVNADGAAIQPVTPPFNPQMPPLLPSHTAPDWSKPKAYAQPVFG